MSARFSERIEDEIPQADHEHDYVVLQGAVTALGMNNTASRGFNSDLGRYSSIPHKEPGRGKGRGGIEARFKCIGIGAGFDLYRADGEDNEKSNVLGDYFTQLESVTPITPECSEMAERAEKWMFDLLGETRLVCGADDYGLIYLFVNIVTTAEYVLNRNFLAGKLNGALNESMKDPQSKSLKDFFTKHLGFIKDIISNNPVVFVEASLNLFIDGGFLDFADTLIARPQRPDILMDIICGRYTLLEFLERLLSQTGKMRDLLGDKTVEYFLEIFLVKWINKDNMANGEETLPDKVNLDDLTILRTNAGGFFERSLFIRRDE